MAAAAVWERLEALGPHRVRPGLERIQALLEALDSPHLGYPTAVVAGTNGKGSVASMLAAIGRAAGHRVGCYTSPHLVRVEERFQIDGHRISRAGLGLQLQAVFEAADALLAAGDLAQAPSYFEVLTAAAFRYFAEARVDLAVVEVGLGGRWDATNVTRPRVAVITPVDLEHREFLGPDIRAIAGEKAAVLPPGGLAVVAPQQPGAREAIRRRAEEVGATLWEATEYPVELRRADERLRYSFDCRGHLRSYAGLEVSLPGRHQVENARCALLAAEALDRRRLRIGSDAIWAGLRSARCPGRCEWVEGEPTVLLDGAHNPGAALALAAYLEELRAREAYRRLHLVFGVLRDKDVARMAAALYPLADTVVVTRPPSSRGRDPAEVAGAGPPPPRLRQETEPAAALETVRQEAGAGDLVCVTGSLYLVGAIRALLLQERDQPPDPRVAPPQGRC